MYCAGACFSAALTGIAAVILPATNFSRASFVFSVVYNTITQVLINTFSKEWKIKQQ